MGHEFVHFFWDSGPKLDNGRLEQKFLTPSWKFMVQSINKQYEPVYDALQKPHQYDHGFTE